MPENTDPKEVVEAPVEHHASPEPAPSPLNLTRSYGVMKDLLTLMVIPLLGWGVKLEVGNALRDERISNLKEDLARSVAELEDDMEDIGRVDAVTQDNSKNLIRLEGKLDAANSRLEEIKRLLEAL